MLRSMYSGISGMKVNQTKLDVTGNNIANVGTTGFKSSRVRFQDMLSQNVSEALGPGRNTGGVNGRQVGLGVQVAGIDTVVSQGMMQPTSRNLDVAVDGTGYLLVAKGPVPITNIGTTGSTTAGIVLDTNHNITTANLTPSYTRDGALTLDNEGNLLTSDGYRVMGYALATSAGGTGSIVYGGTVAAPTVTMNFVDGESTTLQPQSPTNLVPLRIPESVGGKRILSFSIEKDGVINAVLDDGTVGALGQIAMASFKNPEGLKKLGKNLYTNTPNSGEAVIRSGKGISGTDDNSKGYGDMLQGMLEMSNVDLSEQFTDMIVTTRAFQAAGKMITTGDEILQEIINLKR